MKPLTPYQQDKFPHLEKSIKDGQWYTIKDDRPDREEFIECLKLYIDTWGNLELNKEETAFRRAYPIGTLIWMAKNDNSENERLIKEMHDKIEEELEKKYPTPKWKKK